MRLSEDRINAIAYKVAFELVKKRLIKTQHRLSQVTAWVEKPILDDLSREEEIEEEVRQTLRSMKSCPPEGSYDYQALFQRKKEELADRRGYRI